MITCSGIFTFERFERQWDRYGFFYLDHQNYEGTAHSAVVAPVEELMAHIDTLVRVTATVTESRKSGHVGDWHRSIYPTTPDVGEVIDLGTGRLKIQIPGDDWRPTERPPCIIGILPEDGRWSDRIDPHKLYRLHDQTVTVSIEVLDPNKVVIEEEPQPGMNSVQVAVVHTAATMTDDFIWKPPTIN